MLASVEARKQKAVPPLRTSHTLSTEKHVWLCASSKARGREWLKKQTTETKPRQMTVETM